MSARTRSIPLGALGLARARRSRLRGQAGFTMIELTVALVSGLIVAMGIVGLSREATNTFNDEARSSAAEAGLRAAIERLRADLQRGGFMSTGNILLDPNLALIPGSQAGSGNQGAYKPTLAAPSCTLKGMCGLQNLASVYWQDNGSNGAGAVNNSLAQSANQTPNALTPDLIQIAGNMTTSEQFDVQMMTPGANVACGSGGTKIYLAPSSPAMVRAFGGATPAAGNASILQNLFSPDGTSSFLLRLVDKSAHVQFLATCAGAAAAGFDGTGGLFVAVDTTNTPILYAGTTTTVSNVGGVSGFCVGCTVNPVQIVEWEITNSSGGATHNEPTSYSGNLGWMSLAKTADTTKYDLMRTYLDATGSFLTGTSEIVAEYAVDLSFAFTGENSLTSLTPAATTATSSCALDDNTGCNTAWGQQVYAATTAGYGPQRIRTVRARLTTRTALPDRAAPIAVAPGQYGVQTYMYRYLLPSTAYPAPLLYARTRTVTTEVALTNQGRNFY
jgi:type II secretory pathway pseudopilin PulG